jgi:hypothetical protein
VQEDMLMIGKKELVDTVAVLPEWNDGWVYILVTGVVCHRLGGFRVEVRVGCSIYSLWDCMLHPLRLV